MDKNIFISYSHTDTALVSPMVQLLRINNEYVFQDFDSITPGKKWGEEINQAIDDAKLFVLFWCKHSKRSKEVQKEYLRAYELEKDILPVLLDNAPLPKKLSEFQWIDFRSIGHRKSIKDRIKRIFQPVIQVLTELILDLRGEAVQTPSDDYFLASDGNQEFNDKLMLLENEINQRLAAHQD